MNTTSWVDLQTCFLPKQIQDAAGMRNIFSGLDTSEPRGLSFSPAFCEAAFSGESNLDALKRSIY